MTTDHTQGYWDHLAYRGDDLITVEVRINTVNVLTVINRYNDRCGDHLGLEDEGTNIV